MPVRGPSVTRNKQVRRQDKTLACGSESDTRLNWLELGDLTKTFGEKVALDGISFGVASGEFFTIIGPSGSGKTTLLRIIGGFESPDRYQTFRLHHLDLGPVPVHRRNIATVFQHYALFPHMTVGRNVEYGLKVRGVRASERRRRALDALHLVRLGETHDRAVDTLSGGERQRVALARAIVTEPAILLLDEPLGALDEKLRGHMQFELKELQRKLGTTFIYVTHNQDEALTMSDRVAVLHDGRLQQIGTPRNVYERPRNRFVAEFMGATNLLPGVLGPSDAGGHPVVQVQGQDFPAHNTTKEEGAVGTSVWLLIRPEHFRVSSLPTPGRACLRGRIVERAYRGSDLLTTYEIGDELVVRVRDAPSADTMKTGDIAYLYCDPDNAAILLN
jgi:spermidine/putrescine transport system ATP-binding protein